MSEPKTFAEQLDAAPDGPAFGKVIEGLMASLLAAKESVEAAAAALEEVKDALEGDNND